MGVQVGGIQLHDASPHLICWPASTHPSRPNHAPSSPLPGGIPHSLAEVNSLPVYTALLSHGSLC